ncbi:hypothetical protein B0H34DRAFT_67150 [Crassisporium funariophilum]|nr:hypothetical protein B0H34DRAFT_67150 [Crassisporium funariophilum]
MVGEMEDTDPLLFRRARSNNSVPQILTSGAGGQRALLSSLFGILRRRSNVRAITAPAQTPALFNVASGATSFLRSIWYPEIESNTLPPSQSPQRNIGEVDDAPVVRQDITSLMGNLSVLSALKCTPPCSNETIPLHLEDTVTSFPPAITSPTNGDLGQPPSIDNHRPSVDSGTNAHVGFHSVSATRKLSSEAATFIESDDGRPDLGPYPVLSGDETGEDFAIVNRTLTATPEPVPHLTVLPTAAAVKISEASAMPVSPYDSSTHYVIVDEKSAYNPIQGENPQSLVCKACLHSFLSELLTQQFHGNSTKGSDRIKNRSGSPTNSHLKGHGNLKQRLNFRRKTMEPAAFQDPSYPNSQSGLPVLPSSRKVERQIDQPRFKFIDDMKNAGWVIRVRGVKKWNFRGQSKDGVIAEPFTNQSSTNTADVTTANGADKPGKGVKGVKAHALLNVFDEKQLSEWNANIRKNPNKQKDFSKLSKSELLQRLWKKLEAQGYSEEVIVKKIEEKGITSVTSKIPDQTTNSTGTYLCDIHRTG